MNNMGKYNKDKTPIDTVIGITNALSNINIMEGVYRMNYYNYYYTIKSFHLPSGICSCEKYNQLLNEYDSFDLKWEEIDDDDQVLIMLEFSNLYHL